MEYQIGTSVFDDWEIVGRIGSGASSVVYEIRKKGQNIGLSSALKVMRIPQDLSVIDSLHREGKDDESISSYLSGIVDELIEEIRIMASLKGSPYIVSCEDYKKIYDPHSGQWEVLIRMELLQPISEFLMENDFTQADVYKLALQMTKALILLEKRGILHRDIKPENIFVNEYGDFKIGDFGIAILNDKASGSLSKAGTENYMAPEVYFAQSYGNTVDIYSLGLILYKFLNKNRLPFYPTDKNYTAMEQQMALQSRMSGKKEMPLPALASSEFGCIILKMCAYRPEDRYQSAEQLLAELEAIAPSDEVVLLRQKSEAARSDSIKSSDSGNLTRAVFAGTAGSLGKGTAGPLGNDAAGSLGNDAAGSLGKDTAGSLGNDAAGSLGKDTAGSSGEKDEQPPVSGTTGEKEEKSADSSSSSGGDGKLPYNLRPGYTLPEKEDSAEKPKRFDVKKLLVAIAALAIVLALVLPRLMAQEFTLTVEGGSGSGSYTSGTSVTVSAPEMEGALFFEWEAEGIDLENEDLYVDEITIKMPRNAVVLRAVYEQLTFQVTVNGGSGSGDYAFDDTVTIEADEPEEGYVFAGWQINSGSPSITDTTAQSLSFVIDSEEDIELTAAYEQVDYQLTVNNGDGGGSYHYGDLVSISADSEMDGMTFSYWSVDSGSLELSDLTALNISFTMPAEDLVLSAHYAIEKYTVKVTNGSGNGMYTVGDTVTVSADSVNDQGYAFSSWSVDGTNLDTSPIDLTQPEISFIMPAGDVTLTAVYAEQKAETVAAASAETYVLSVNGGSGSGTYAVGETITVTCNTPESGMTFAYWFITGYPDSIDASAEELVITMPENDVTIVAVYVQE